jgi:hypothetical protein
MHEHLVEKRFHAIPFVMQEHAMLTQFEERTRKLHERAGLGGADANLIREVLFDPFDND